MDTSHRDGVQEREPSNSRRRFFVWVGQVAAGTSLASIGLSLTNPRSVTAAAANGSAPSITYQPDCIPCTAHCVFGYCSNDNCSPPLNPYSIRYTVYQQACIQPGQSCPYTVHQYCGSSCCAGVPGNCGCP